MIASFSFPELQARGPFSTVTTVLLALLTLAALVGVVLLYLREAGRLGIVTRLVLAALRMAIVAFVAFLLVRPVLVFEKDSSRPRPVGVLVDVSESMKSEDPRPNSADQWRVAIAYGKAEADKGLPSGSPPTALMLPERPTRLDVAREALANPKLDLFPKLAKAAGQLDVFTFGLHRTGRDWQSPDWLKGLAAIETKTALVDCAFELLNRSDADVPAALLLVTDGRENGSGKSLDDLARECVRRQVPVYVYGVGSSAFGQLRFRDMIVPETMFVDDLVVVPIRYAVKGVKDGVADIVLKHGEKEVARKQARFKAGEDIRETLSFVPSKEDAARKQQELTATITIATGNGTETLTDSMTRPAQVIDKKLKVLVIDSIPRFDFKFLQRALLRDRRVEAKFYLTEGDKAAMRSGPPWMVELSRELNGTLNLEREEFRKLLFDFDLLVLGAVPGKYFTDEHQKVIREFVTEGGGMIHIAGKSYDQADKWNGPAAWAGDWKEVEDRNGVRRFVPTKPPSPIGELLPVEFKAVRSAISDLVPPAPFVPVMAPAAVRSPLVSLEDDAFDNAELWGKFGNPGGAPNPKQLKPMYWYYPVLKTKPAADVYLVHPVDRTPAPDNKPMPLLVGHFYGKGYVLFVGFDETWRWRYNEADKRFGRFWSQAIYTAGLSRTVGTKLTQLSLDNLDPVKGGTGQVYARVFGENFKLLTAEELDATLEKMDGDPNDKDRVTQIKLHKLAGQDGEYMAAIPFNNEGRFKLTVDPKNKTPASLEYRVTRAPDDELAPGSMDEEAMRKLCDATGGKFYREEDLHHLPQDVKPQSVVTHHRYEWIFWDAWSMVALIVLLSVEWVLRKFNGLS